MSYYHTCPHCGANLDPGEQCSDCREKEAVTPTNHGRSTGKSTNELLTNYGKTTPKSKKRPKS